MRNRDINNRIHILEKVSKKFEIESDVKFVREKFDEYVNVVGENIINIQSLPNLENELRRPIDLIDSKLFDIAIKIYN